MEVVAVPYTNWRGETSVRRIIPKSVRFGSTEWHPEPQWLLLAWDADKQADREFALKDFGASVADAYKVALTNAMISIEEQRIKGVANFHDPRYAGQRGADHADALHDAYHTIRGMRDGTEAPAPSNPVTWVDAAEIIALIDKLRFDEGDSVTILCDNPDFNGQPDRVIVVNGAWTDWQDRRFGADTLVQALRAAVGSRQLSKAGEH